MQFPALRRHLIQSAPFLPGFRAPAHRSRREFTLLTIVVNHLSRINKLNRPEIMIPRRRKEIKRLLSLRYSTWMREAKFPDLRTRTRIHARIISRCLFATIGTVTIDIGYDFSIWQCGALKIQLFASRAKSISISVFWTIAHGETRAT